jgi:predicted kinase
MPYTHGMKHLTLIVISGLPGSGKSTLAESMAKALQLPVLSVDPIESSIIKSGIARSFETGLAAYLVVQTVAEEQLKLGLSVIIDAVSPVREAREMWRTLSVTYHAQLVVIECVLDKDMHQQRLAHRRRNLYGLPEVRWEDVEARRHAYLPWEQARLVLDTAHDPESNLGRALAYIGGDSATNGEEQAAISC